MFHRCFKCLISRLMSSSEMEKCSYQPLRYAFPFISLDTCKVLNSLSKTNPWKKPRRVNLEEELFMQLVVCERRYWGDV